MAYTYDRQLIPAKNSVLACLQVDALRAFQLQTNFLAHGLKQHAGSKVTYKQVRGSLMQRSAKNLVTNPVLSLKSKKQIFNDNSNAHVEAHIQ